jgi:hypothetical protein
VQCRQGREQCCFAGAAGPDDRGQLAGFNRKSDVVERSGSIALFRDEARCHGARASLRRWSDLRWRAIGSDKRTCVHEFHLVERSSGTPTSIRARLPKTFSSPIRPEGPRKVRLLASPQHIDAGVPAPNSRTHLGGAVARVRDITGLLVARRARDDGRADPQRDSGRPAHARGARRTLTARRQPRTARSRMSEASRRARACAGGGAR